MNIRQLTAELANDAAPRAELRLLLSHVLSRSTAWLAAHDDYELTPAEENNLRVAASRRVAGEPIAYILGYREFYGRKFKCTPAALIPRPETELLIDQVCGSSELLARPEPVEGSSDAVLQVLDVGTGTGCIAITLALELPNAQITACDLSRDALALARENARALGATNVEHIESDWFSAIDANKMFDVIVSNPPYIAPNDPHLFRGDLRFEPWLALRDRVDGLESYRELVKGAKKHLRDDGLLIVEHGYDQGESVPALFREAGFSDVEMIR
ncbi:MAG: peptide chain release factor N(5)-glutamine methyltransferase, partial [Casimicrobium sp.]